MEYQKDYSELSVSILQIFLTFHHPLKTVTTRFFYQKLLSVQSRSYLFSCSVMSIKIILSYVVICLHLHIWFLLVILSRAICSYCFFNACFKYLLINIIFELINHRCLPNLHFLFSFCRWPYHNHNNGLRFLSFYRLLSLLWVSCGEAIFQTIYNISPIFFMPFLGLLAFRFSIYGLFFSWKAVLVFFFICNNLFSINLNKRILFKKKNLP